MIFLGCLGNRQLVIARQASVNWAASSTQYNIPVVQCRPLHEFEIDDDSDDQKSARSSASSYFSGASGTEVLQGCKFHCRLIVVKLQVHPCSLGRCSSSPLLAKLQRKKNK